MRSDPEGVVEAAIQAYALKDLDAAAKFFHPDIVYAMYVDQDVLPFAGVTQDRDQLLAMWRQLIEAFELLEYTPRGMSTAGDVVRTQVVFAFRHRASGEVIDGIMRLVFEVRDGLITRGREYHDVERIRAFMRLTGKPYEDTA